MSLRPSYMPNSQSSILLQEIKNAFVQVNVICKEFMERGKKSSLTHSSNLQPPRHINFNNYKGKHDAKTDLAEKIKSIDIDGENSQDSIRYNGTVNNHKPNTKQDAKGRGPNAVIKEKEQKNREQKTTNKLLTKISSHSTNTIPAPPKAPISPYFTFYKDKKDVIKNEFPEMSVSEITAAAAKVWKSLTDEEREPFNEKYFVEKEKYNQLMKEYVEKYPNYREMHKKGIQLTGQGKK